MQATGRRILLCIGVLAAVAGPAQSVEEFVYHQGLTYASVNGSLPYYEFFATIESGQPWGQDLWIEISSYTPNGWSTQVCQTRTNICFTEDGLFYVPEGVVDTLRYDFVTPPGNVGTGWINVRIYRFEDPTVWVEATYALGHGVTLPTPSYSFTIDEAFQQANPGDLVEFYAQLVSHNSFPDSLYCTLQPSLPDGWLAQACHEPSDICIFEEGLIPLDAYASDILRVDMITSMNPGIGSLRVLTQSKANPAFRTAVVFRVRTGDIPSAVDDRFAPANMEVRAVPNPLRDVTDLRVLLQRPSSVRLWIADAGGRIVSSRTTAQLPEGAHQLRWDGTDDQGRVLPGGIYFYRIDGGTQTARGKLTLQR